MPCGLRGLHGKEYVMSTHRFALGEVVLCTERRSHAAWKAPFVIADCIATSGIDPLYRIRSLHWHETRIAGEHELSRMPQPHRAIVMRGELSLDDRFGLEAANVNAQPAADLPFPSPYRQPMFGGHHV